MLNIRRLFHKYDEDKKTVCIRDLECKCCLAPCKKDDSSLCQCKKEVIVTTDDESGSDSSYDIYEDVEYLSDRLDVIEGEMNQLRRSFAKTGNNFVRFTIVSCFTVLTAVLLSKQIKSDVIPT